VKNGDGAADLKPIAHLYKSQVYELARHLGVPEEIQLARPLDLAMWLVSRETYHHAPRGTRLERVEAFDDAFNAFWARLRKQHAIVGERDAEYMTGATRTGRRGVTTSRSCAAATMSSARSCPT
jgi:hypothetical protein